MIVDTKSFFNLLRIHHKLPVAHRQADLTGRLSTMADAATGERMRVDPLTRRCLGLFIARRLQPSISNQQDVG